jgi:gas vesicle protein
MKRLAIGAALGGLAVYLYDPSLGGERRDRLSSLWRENRDNRMQVGRAASQAADSVRPLARRMTKAVGSGDWAKAVNPRRHAASLPLVIGAVAVGGALVYFLTPVKGAERRQRVLSAWRENGHATMEAGRRAARQTAEAVKPVVSRVSDGVADAVEDVKVMVS